MNKLLVIFGALFLAFIINGCAAKQEKIDNSYYDRANKASSESLKNFD